MIATPRRFAAVLSAAVASALGAQSPILAEFNERALPTDAGTGATAMAIADFDGDGDRDVVLCGSRGSLPRSPVFLAGAGDGSFVAVPGRIPPSLIGHVVALAAGDVDGDGDVDLVAGVNRGKDRLLRNDGNGTFSDDTQGHLDLDGGATSDVALVDLDGDGDLDLLIGSQYTVSTFSRIAINDGTGAFSDPAAARLPDRAFRFAALDADGDGDTDIAAYADSGGTAQSGAVLLLNDGQGRLGLAPPGSLPGGPVLPSAIRAADIDADGDPDLLISEFDPGPFGGRGLLVWVNDGTGTFTDESATRAANLRGNFVGLATGDLDGDGDVDLVLPATAWGFVAGNGDDAVLINDGTGVFVDRASALGFEDPPQQTGATALTDIDGDGDPDLLLLTDVDGLREYLNLGDGRLRLANARSLPGDSSNDDVLLTADFDRDGDRDAFVAGAAGARLLRNDGLGRLVDDSAASLPVGIRQLGAAAALDADGDGDLDIAGFGDRSYLLVNDGSGRFVDAPAGALPAQDPWALTDVAVGDVDGDGDDDLVAAGPNQVRSLYLGDGAGSFTDAGRAAFAGQSATITWCVDLGDVDGDGDLDAVFGLFDRIQLVGAGPEIWRNDGAGNFTRDPAAIRGARRATTDVVLLDVDGDGDLDLFQAAMQTCRSSAVEDSRLYLNDGAGTFVDASATHLPGLEAQTWSVAVGDLNGDDRHDLVLANGMGSRACTAPNFQNLALINDGTGRYVDATFSYLPVESDQARVAALTDFDGDGDPELYLARSYAPTGDFDDGVDVLLKSRRVQVDTPELVRVGGRYALDLHAARAPQPAGVMALPILSPATVDVPLGILGTLRVDGLAGDVLAPVAIPPSGVVRITRNVPNDPNLIGATIHAQALFMDGANPARWRLSNAVGDLIH